jgi:small subunit ribosomal protein S2
MSTYKFYPQHYTIQSLLEAGVHFGHTTRKWEPKMLPYVFGVRRGVHIIDLHKTVEMMEVALRALAETAAQNGRILFVCTKKQATDYIQQYAQQCGQYFINSRWLGGTLTNWSTVSASLKTLREYENTLNNPKIHLTKNELLRLRRKYDKMNRAIGGVRNMGGLPDMLFVIDAHLHKTAVKEALSLGIPIVSVVDTNTDPTPINYPIPGNDDSRRAIELYAKLAATAIISGMQNGMKDVSPEAKQHRSPRNESSKADSQKKAPSPEQQAA